MVGEAGNSPSIYHEGFEPAIPATSRQQPADVSDILSLAAGAAWREPQARRPQVLGLKTNAGVVLCAALLILGGVARSESVSVQLTYPQDDLSVTRRGDVMDVRLAGGDLLPRVGAPALPRRTEQIVLPEGSVARSATVASLSSIWRGFCQCLNCPKSRWLFASSSDPLWGRA